MALNWIDICNNALALIGGKGINNLDEPSPEARNCKKFLVQARQALLSDHPWNCATNWAELALVGEAGVDGKPRWPYRYAFAVPADFLRVIRLEDGLPSGSLATLASPGIPYQLAAWQGQQIVLCERERATLVYVADVDNPRLLDAKLRDVLIFTLAARLALPVSEGTQRAQMFEQKAAQALDEARLADARSGHEIVPRDDTWLREQAGYTPGEAWHIRNWGYK